MTAADGGSVYDSHMHYVPRAALAQLDVPGMERLGVRYDAELDRFVRIGETHQGIPSSLLDLQDPVDGGGHPVIQVLSPWSDLIRDDVPEREGADWCRVLNDAVWRDIEQRAGFRAYAAIPISSPEVAAEEFERAVSLGFVGGMIPTQVGGRNLDDWGIDPLLEVSERLGAPIFVHPAKTFGRERFMKHFLRNMCGYPFETTVAAFSLFFSAAFERYPGARVLLSHCGGTLPFLAGRAVHATSAVPDFGRAGLSVRDIVEPFFFDCVVADPDALAFGLAVVGPERMVLGSDGPFSMGLADPVSQVREAARIAGLDPEAVFRAVAIQTPERMYGAAG
ncbi:amidohydrolase family protein [Amycolatopsis pithecellobii]|uniref:Amidohydrolase family protein n=1 Tax=Amycolatopsis pithecellobii TaxID=664692 RepID=A0A6N7Z589_9PSEU|nr:amidohydrolase family protein [Amycolatopsis pithecellobii]MTD55640.1 amidohydrolase family protein [Amycolatopsis pithecellobii]